MTPEVMNDPTVRAIFFRIKQQSVERRNNRHDRAVLLGLLSPKRI